MSFESHKAIIDAWPSRADLAADMGVSYDTVKKWHQRNSIPSHWWTRLVRHAIKRDIAGVSFEVLDATREISFRQVAAE
jgi:hypothetical protein